jgi:dihydroorotase
MNSLLMRRAAEYARSFGLTVMDHCEDLNLSQKGVMNEGAVSTELGLMGMPSAAEEAHVARDIAVARLTGAHFHITHVSTAASLELIRSAKKERLNVTCDVTPHHLTLTDEDVTGYNTGTKVNPPLRTKKDVEALVKGLTDGTIDAIATDHAPHGLIDKELGFDTASFGITGLETALPVVLKLVHDKKLTMERMARLLTCGMNVLGGRGYSAGLKKGAPADVTIFDPDEKVVIDPTEFHSKGKNTPFAGWKLKGRVAWTILDGRIVFDNEKGISSPLGRQGL